ncbi:GNAT family N-acetyltransferase [Janthinobacterium fluminis]|uniref:GNAT family N-acetyltransferase n=1 Tax=Janthinobacterium fluminis TaxID=2987524 RepID=A0ABT5K2Q5_9BURK|nr:GNAT family N-acetyltransferase [Janthinobacterium fluminis]MDC8759149.1 GNAT family N-acetyltransferase [Janthinobacterium fluminis]
MTGWTEGPTITLKAAAAADIPALWALRTDAVRRSCASYYAPGIIAVWSAAPLPPVYAALVAGGGAVMAESAGELQGYAILDRGNGEVGAVFVAPDSGGRGVGKILLGALERMARADRRARLHLYASLNAVGFYRAAGFVPLREAQYAHPSGIALDCVYMEKALLPGA